jgi:hypothetical protein
MPRTRSSFALLTAALALAAPAAWAQSAAAPAVPDDTAGSPIFAPKPAGTPAPAVARANDDDHGDPRRIQSSELNDALVNSLPKYAPPKPVVAKPDAEQADLRDTDKPKNGIIRLPKYVVQESAPPPIFTKKDVLTEQGRRDLAMRQYIIDTKDMPGFAAGLSNLLFQDNAAQQYADAERSSNISSLRSDATAAAVGGDAAESSFIREQSDDTYLRRADWAPIGSSTKTSSSGGDVGGGNGQ